MTAERPPRRGRRRHRADAAAAVPWSVAREFATPFGVAILLGVAVGVVWWLVAPEVHATVSGGQPSIDQVESTRWFDIDAWLGVLGGAAGFGFGIVTFLRWRGRPVLVAVLNVVAGLAGSAVAWQVGRLLGPGPVPPDLPDGSRVALPMDLHAYGMFLIWPIAGVVAILLVNALLDDRTPAA